MFTVREMCDMLPLFNLLDANKEIAGNFLGPIQDLRVVYEFDEKLLLFATQSNLRVYAKTWILKSIHLVIGHPSWYVHQQKKKLQKTIIQEFHQVEGLNLNHRTNIYEPAQWTNQTENYIFHNLQSLLYRNNNIKYAKTN